MQPNTMKIDDVEYVRADSVAKPETTIQIVNLPYGNVVAGRVEDLGDKLRIYDAAVVRIWGTTKGLGEIAEGGPTDKTKLDKCPPLTIQKTACVFRMDCKEGNWDVAIKSM